MSRRNLVWLVVLAALAFLFYRLPRMAAGPDPLNRVYSPLLEVDALIRQNYVEAVPDPRLAEGAIRGIMRELDPYSGYIGPAEMEAFRRTTTGRYIGIGIEAGIQHGKLVVIAAIDEGPAMQAGLRAGDVILAVDGQPTDDLTVSDVSELVHGPAGTEVTLTVRHRGAADAETIPVIRGPVSVHVVKGVRRRGPAAWDYLLDPQAGVAYVRVSSFQGNTIDDFDAALDKLREIGIKALILDLRFNPGGLLGPAIDMVDRFLAQGTIVSTVTRQQAVEEYYAHPEDEFPDVPLVVLINGASASAAEIVAGSLQAHGRATIVGTRSFGKGVVQHIINLRTQSAALRLTAAYYKLPNGRIIHKTPANAGTDEWGIQPDIEVVVSDAELAAIETRRTEVDSLPPEPATQRTTAPATAPTADEDAAAGILIDRQLAAALEWLTKGP